MHDTHISMILLSASKIPSGSCRTLQTKYKAFLYFIFNCTYRRETINQFKKNVMLRIADTTLNNRKDFNPKILNYFAAVKENTREVIVEVMKYVAATSKFHIVRNATHHLLESNTEKNVKRIGDGKRVDNNKCKLSY